VIVPVKLKVAPVLQLPAKVAGVAVAVASLTVKGVGGGVQVTVTVAWLDVSVLGAVIWSDSPYVPLRRAVPEIVQVSVTF
jgi:hypothetical protein